MLPSLTGGFSGGGAGLGGMAQGAISIDTSGARRAVPTMRQVGQDLERAMDPAIRSLESYERALRSAMSRGGVDLSGVATSMRSVGQETEEAARRIGGGAEKATSGIRALHLTMLEAVAGFALISRSASAAWQALQRGAELQLTAERFDRLAESIGTTGEALKTDLADATAGMLTDAQAMSLATDLISLSLVKNHDDAVRLGRVVTELNQDVGELVLALSNQTTKRFDQLNVSVEGFNKRLTELKKTMSDEEAFTLAFIEQGEEQIRRVGGASRSAAGDLRRLEADWQNLSDDFKVWLLGRLEPVVATASGRYGDEIADIAEANRDAAKSYEELIRIIKSTDETIGTGFMANLVGGLDELQAQQVENIRAALHMSESYEQWEADMVAIFGSVGMAWEVLWAGFDRTGEIETMRQLGIDSAEAWYNYERALAAATGADVKFTGETQKSVRALRELDDVLHDVQRSLDIHARQLEMIDAYEARREGIDSGDLASRLQQEELAEAFERDQQRTEAIVQWAEDVQAIEDEANAARLAATQQAEEQRTRVVAAYALQRAREEEDFVRNRRRANLHLQDQIQGIIQERQEQEIRWQQELNERIAAIQEEAARERQRMEQDHQDNLLSAASRLDARAVAEEQRRYNRQRTRFEEDLQIRIDAEQEAHQRRLQQAREADEKRIRDLQEHHRRRQAEEDEDRAIRLERMEEDHQRQLDEMDVAQRQRITQINRHALEERNELDKAFRRRLAELGLHNQDWLDMQERRQREALTLFEEWWDAINDELSTGVRTGSEHSRGGSGGQDPDVGQRPSRSELMQQSISLMQQTGWEPRAVYNQTRAMQSWTDAQIARWLERTFGIDIPGYLMGTPFVPRTGLAWLHQGEAVLNRVDAAMMRNANITSGLSGGATTLNINRGAVNINAPAGASPYDIGVEVELAIIRIADRARRGQL